MTDLLTTVDAARELNTSEAKIRKAADSLGDEIPRITRMRIIPRSVLPKLRAALDSRSSGESQ